MRRLAICLFSNLFVCLFAKGQHVSVAGAYNKEKVVCDTTSGNISTATLIFNSALHHSSNTLIKTVPSTFYYNSIGFFCQKELQVEKSLRFPVKFRLGSVAYTDEMEGKGKGFLKP